MDLKFDGQGSQVETTTDGDFQGNLQRLKSHRDGRGMTTALDQDLCVIQAIGHRVFESRKRSSELRELLLDGHYTNSGRLVCQSVALSKTRAVLSNLSSAKAGAMSWRPIGRPDLVRPQGILRPGIPARLVVMV